MQQGKNTIDPDSSSEDSDTENEQNEIMMN